MDVQSKLLDFFSKYSFQSFKKGEIIIRSSDATDHIYYLKIGSVRQYFVNSDGDEITLHVFKSGSYLPMMLLLSNTENKYNFEAFENIEVYRAPAEDVFEFVKSDPDVLLDLATRMSTGLSKILIKIEKLLFKDSYSKVISLLIYLAEKFGERKDDKVKIKLQFTHSDIGSWIGLPRETVSRQMEKLTEDNLIFLDEHLIVIQNIETLKSKLT